MKNPPYTEDFGVVIQSCKAEFNMCLVQYSSFSGFSRF